MSSIIEGYNYDIFISYRQKDNKGDRWVSEFVDSLKTELESTFKEEISVYFDINPHDGLLETHDVDESLKEKLKCLIFIPIISRTYCDPKSYAWEHEFKAFIELALKDRFGLKVKMANGNVASRILPVRIHDLDPEDIKLVETQIGIIRSIDFIYKSTGVNRPLRANEDHPQDNFNKTYYRDQINKVANAVNEIIDSLKKSQISECSENYMSEKPIYENAIIPSISSINLDLKSETNLQNKNNIIKHKLSTIFIRNTKKLIYTLILIVVLTGIIFGWKDFAKIFSIGNSGRESAKLHIENAVKYFKNKDYQTARTEAELALKIDPKYSYAWSTLAAVSVKEGNLNKAILETIEAVKSDPHNYEAAYNMAYALDDKGDFRQAEKWYSKAIEIDSAFIPAYSALGRIYNLQSVPIDAILILDRALKKYPHSEYNYLLYKNLGNAFLLQGMNDTAVKYLELSREIQPDELETNLFLAKAYEAVGNINKSIDLWQSYIELETDTAKRNEAKVHLKEITIRHLREVIQ